MFHSYWKAITQSWHEGGTETESVGGTSYGFASESNGSDTYGDRRLDLMASTFPYPMICQAVGNISSTGEFANHKGYNTLVVGQDLRDGYTMSPGSVSKNPSNRQELPHVTAGVAASAQNPHGTSVFEDQNGNSVVTDNGATSMAAAMATGFVASLQSVNPTLLQHSPWAVKAIVMASGDNIEGETWTTNPAVDLRDGTGRMNGIDAAQMAANPYTSGVGGGNGFFIDQITNGTSYSHSITIVPTQSEHLTVAVAWFSNINTTNYLSTLSDLDLEITGPGGKVFSSKSSTNPEEVVVIPNPEAGREYTIKITTVRPVSYATNFGVAWVNR